MDFIEGTSGVYRPIRVLFDARIYDRALQLCWNLSSYKSQIAMLLELLKLQQKNLIPSQVTAEDMINLLQEKSKNSLRERLWQFELEGWDEEEVKPLLKLMWAVNISNKRRDVEFEAQMLLNSPEALPPNFQNPKVFSLAHRYAKTLTERQQEAPCSRPLSPQEVVMEVVPRVLQGFWVLPPRPLLNMPSQRLSKVSVGVTKAVSDRVSAALLNNKRLATFSRSIRDDMVMSILTKIRQMHTREILVKRLNSFSPVHLSEIVDVAADQICGMFQPLSPEVPARLLTPTAEPAATTPVHKDAEREPPASRPDGHSVASPPPAPLALPAEPSSIPTVQAREDENTTSSLEKTPVEFVEWNRGVYRPIMALFETSTYDRALKFCWNMTSYKTQISLLLELLKLQQKNLIPSQVTAEDMVNLIQEESKNTLRERLWQFEVEDHNKEEVKPLLKLMWAVNISNKRRDVEFEAQMLLNSPEALPPNFQNPKVFSLAHQYAKTLTERQQEAPCSRPLSPQEVVMEVVPRVLQGFWVLPPRPLLNMPSQRLSKVSVGVTKAVSDRVSAALLSNERLATFSRSIRDDMVMSILTKIRQMHTREILVKRLNSFSPVHLSEIVDVAADQICGMFQPLSPEVPARLLTPTAEPAATTPVHKDAEREPPASRPDGHSVALPPPAPKAPQEPPSVPAGRRILRPRRRMCATAAALKTEPHHVTVGQIYGTFQPQSPKVPAHLSPTANPPVTTTVQEDSKLAEKQEPEPISARTSAVVSPPPAPLAPSNEHLSIPATRRILRPRRRKCATTAALQTDTHESH